MNDAIRNDEVRGERSGSAIKIVQKLITAMIVLASVGLTLITPRLFYRLGLNVGEGGTSGACFLLFPLLWVGVFFLLLCQSILVVLTAFIYGLKRSGQSLGILGICIISICVCWLLFFLIGKPGYVYFSEGFHDRMEREVNVGEIQKWLQTIEKPVKSRRYIVDTSGPPKDLEFYGPETTFIKSLDSPDWPETMRALFTNPKIICIRPYRNQEATILLVWGGAFSRWGIAVGPPDMEVPESDMKRGGEYRLKFAPGAYVWHEIR